MAFRIVPCVMVADGVPDGVLQLDGVAMAPIDIDIKVTVLLHINF